MLPRIFFNEKPVKTLACLTRKDKVWYPSMIAKEIDCTYPHMMNVLNMFESEGLIETESMGRIRLVRLTEFGEDLARDFENVLRRMEKRGAK